MSAPNHSNMPAIPERIRFDSGSPDQTARLGERLAARLEPGDTVLVTGDLGAGKTRFIQGICAGLGIGEPVTSPTFTLVNEYDGRLGRLRVAHFDFYRLDSPDSVLELGFDEYVDTCVCLVEWGDKFPEIMPSDAITVHIEIGDGTRRVLEITGGGLVSDPEEAAP
ncbi:MAG: tRNA (adenosine(37)-N6)-threonylcarbamoyltransferase complex ATPase subunit type 1 TsaE [Gemmatimonadetes bacterium]|nr:tRNA (adenosine(37)-N6)-threonylcarbamoyltransferase complex ATPase subunit type 1 TsaE [Gemmatimonadota bacterium]